MGCAEIQYHHKTNKYALYLIPSMLNRLYGWRITSSLHIFRLSSECSVDYNRLCLLKVNKNPAWKLGLAQIYFHSQTQSNILARTHTLTIFKHIYIYTFSNKRLRKLNVFRFDRESEFSKWHIHKMCRSIQ